MRYSFLLLMLCFSCGTPGNPNYIALPIQPPSIIETYPHPTLDTNITVINQGGWGDCWFEAGLGAYTYAQPSYLQTRIFNDPNGSWDIKFNDDRGNPFYINVNSIDLQSWPGNRENQNTLNWPAIFEIAYFKINGVDAQEIEYGGNPIQTFYSLGNANNTIIDYGSTIPYNTLVSMFAQGIDFPTTASTDPNASPPFISNHAYTVLGMDDQNVLLFNPWGLNCDNNNPNTIFLNIDVKQVMKSFFLYVQQTF